MSTTLPLTVSSFAKAGAPRASTNAATVNPANSLRIQTPSRTRRDSRVLYHILILYCAYEERVNAGSAGARQRRHARCAKRADELAPRRPDGRPNPLAQARRIARDFAGRPLGGVHCSRNELGRERVRDRNLARRRGVGFDAPADEREEIELGAGLVARRLEAGVRVGPHRQAADLPH